MNEIITINGKNYKLIIEEVSKYAELLEKRRAYLHTNFGNYLETEAEQLAAVQQNGCALRYIKEPSDAVQLAAVQQAGYALQYIKEPSEAMKLAAVQQNGYVLQYINDQSNAVIDAALAQQPDSYIYIKR